MSIRNLHLSATRLGLAASVALAAITGCDASREGSTDSASVTVPEPSASASVESPPSAPVGTETATVAESPSEATASASSPAGAASGWGTLKGRVVFGGDPPEQKIMFPKGDKTLKDPNVCAASADIPDQRLVVDPESKGVRFAIVYIPKPTAVNPEAESEARAREVDFDQKNCVFVPHVLAFIKGSDVTLKSSDATGHNVNTLGLNNNKFNLPTQPLSSTEQVFKQGETRPGKVVCDIHSWMSAYMLVANNPYFAVTDAQGNFEIKNVPAGEQKVVVWAEALGPGFLTASSGEPIAIKADGETTKDFTMEPSKVKLK